MMEPAEKHAVLEFFPCSLCSQDGTHVFEGVPLCASCHTQVLHRFHKFEKQLQDMMVTLRSSFRESLVQGTLP